MLYQTLPVNQSFPSPHPSPSEEQQRQGWQAILNNLAKHVVAKDIAAK
jgi:hypothetical protein